jgi:hypothetical protein
MSHIGYSRHVGTSVQACWLVLAALHPAWFPTAELAGVHTCLVLQALTT